MVGGAAVGVDGGGGGGAPQWLQTLLVPHVGSPRSTAVRGGQVQRRTALQRMDREDEDVKLLTDLFIYLNVVKSRKGQWIYTHMFFSDGETF